MSANSIHKPAIIANNQPDYSDIDPETQDGVVGVDRGLYVLRLGGVQLDVIPADNYQIAYAEWLGFLRLMRQESTNV